MADAKCAGVLRDCVASVVPVSECHTPDPCADTSAKCMTSGEYVSCLAEYGCLSSTSGSAECDKAAKKCHSIVTSCLAYFGLTSC